MTVLDRIPNESNREYAFRVIRDNIISMDIKPGSLVGEQELATQLGLSRTPVHEAFLELSKSKIVEIYPQRGSRVSLIDFDFVEEANFIRRTIESAIVELACDMATEEDLHVLDENVRLQEFYLENSPAKIMELDNQFHYYLYRICNKAQCYYFVQSMSIHFDRIRNLSLHSVKDLKIIGDHKAIVEAIRARDKEQAKAVLAKHLSRYHIDEAEMRAAYPEYFLQENV